VGNRCADHVTPLYPQKLALTSPIGGGRSVGIVRVRTKATELYSLYYKVFAIYKALYVIVNILEMSVENISTGTCVWRSQELLDFTVSKERLRVVLVVGVGWNGQPGLKHTEFCNG